MEDIDLKMEQQLTLSRPRLHYSVIAKLFFWGMDLITGKKLTLAKAKLLETLACIPYREWEIRKYQKITKYYTKQSIVKDSREIIKWAREAQDNEYWHLMVLHEKMKEDKISDTWYLSSFVRLGAVMFYVFLSRIIAFLNITWAYDFNAQFEDHAEHVYAQFVSENPEWENQPMNNPLVKEYSNVATWADVFRRIGLDERDHMNNSFLYSNQTSRIVSYLGMPRKS